MSESVSVVVGDYARLDRACAAASAEVDALRQLVRDMVEATVPGLPEMSEFSAYLWEPEDWQARARRVCAGCALVTSDEEAP